MKLLNQVHNDVYFKMETQEIYRRVYILGKTHKLKC